MKLGDRHRASDRDGALKAVILVVDDEKNVRTLVTQILRADGYAALSACDAKEALGVLRDCPSKISLVITDVDLPGLNGIDLCAELNKRQPGMKLITMSGQPREIPVSMPFMEKPFSIATLLEKVHAVLSTSLPPDSARLADT